MSIVYVCWKLSKYLKDLNFSGRKEFQKDSDYLLKIFLFFFLVEELH